MFRPSKSKLEKEGEVINFRCFYNGKHGHIVGRFQRNIICSLHKKQIKAEQIEPLFDDPIAANETFELMEVLPTGNYTTAVKLLWDGKAAQALPSAQKSAAWALMGLIRGRIRIEMNRQPGTPLAEETERLFFESWAVERALLADPVASFDLAFDYFEQLPLRFRIVVPARLLIEELRRIGNLIADLPYGDLASEVARLNGLLQHAIVEPTSINPATLTSVREKVRDLRQREHSVRLLVNVTEAPKAEKQQRKQHRGRVKEGKRENRSAWRQRIGYESAV